LAADPSQLAEPTNLGYKALSPNDRRPYFPQKTIRRPEVIVAGGCLLLTCFANYVWTIRGVMKKMSSWFELLTV
jgi:hypothetical protein